MCLKHHTNALQTHLPVFFEPPEELMLAILRVLLIGLSGL